MALAPGLSVPPYLSLRKPRGVGAPLSPGTCCLRLPDKGLLVANPGRLCPLLREKDSEKLSPASKGMLAAPALHLGGEGAEARAPGAPRGGLGLT